MNRTLRNALITAVAAIGLAVGIGAPAMATPANPATPSQCGAAHAASADVNGPMAQYVAHGGTPALHDGATGQDPGATGYNNSQHGLPGLI